MRVYARLRYAMRSRAKATLCYAKSREGAHIGSICIVRLTMNKLKLSINQIELEVDNGTTILQACESIGIVVPRFCYHEKLSVAGNCRMCLVEVGNKTPDGKISMIPKLQASCAIPVTNGMVVITESVSVKKAREGIMELLLVNHPLDCPICDQGGECDLQDQSMTYGSDHGRLLPFKSNHASALGNRSSNSLKAKAPAKPIVVESSLLAFNLGKKRAVKDKNFGPLIKTIMTRCIHCTRCVRFASEIAGCGEIGTIGRGNNLEIARSAFDTSKLGIGSDSKSGSTAGIQSSIAGALLTEVSGNLIDVCPVGALTSAPYAFTARPWELRSIESIDMSDSYGSKIRADVRGSIMRILPSKVAALSSLSEQKLSAGSTVPVSFCRLSASGWISDKTRFSYDGLKRQRINLPMVADNTQSGRNLKKVSWEEAINYAASLLTSGKSNNLAVVGSSADVEGLNVLKQKLSAQFSKIILTEVATRHSTVSAAAVPVSGVNNAKKSIVSVAPTVSNSVYTDLTSVHPSLVECIPSLTWYKANLTGSITSKVVASEPDLILLVGCNPRMEATGLNLDLKELGTLNNRRVANGQTPFQIASIGAQLQLSYPVKHLGTNLSCLNAILDGKHAFCRELNKASHPLIIVGSSIVDRDDSTSGSSIYSKLLAWCNSKLARSLFVLHNTPSHPSALTVGYHSVENVKSLTAKSIASTQNTKSSDLDAAPNVLLLWNVHPDNTKFLSLGVSSACSSVVELCSEAKANGTKLIYVGSHGNELAAMADVILPSTAFTERESSVVNSLGLIQRTRVITSAPGQAREDWSILQALSEACGVTGNKSEHKLTPVSSKEHSYALATYVPASITKWNIGKVLSVVQSITQSSKSSLASTIVARRPSTSVDYVWSQSNPTLTTELTKSLITNGFMDRRQLAVYSSLTGNLSTIVGKPNKGSSATLSPLHTTIDNYYMTDQVSANSIILTKASKGLLLRSAAYSAAADRYLPTIFTVCS
jgi:NADH dehydrogenase (ubiquinone) Fe-S protein 1